MKSEKERDGRAHCAGILVTLRDQGLKVDLMWDKNFFGLLKRKCKIRTLW